MTKPDDIPQDVWERAKMLVISVDGMPSDGNIYNIAKGAIMAEREACADIADTYSASTRSGPTTATNIAAAIRNRGAA